MFKAIGKKTKGLAGNIAEWGKVVAKVWKSQPKDTTVAVSCGGVGELEKEVAEVRKVDGGVKGGKTTVNSLWTPTAKQSDLWNKGKLKQHYEKHGIPEFGAKSSKEYSDMAYEFGTRKSGSIIEVTEGAYVYRYEPATKNIFVGTV